jgi:hypothetical protein
MTHARHPCPLDPLTRDGIREPRQGTWQRICELFGVAASEGPTNRSPTHDANLLRLDTRTCPAGGSRVTRGNRWAARWRALTEAGRHDDGA